MRAFILFTCGAALLASAAPALGQNQSDGQKMVDAVRKEDATTAQQLLREQPTLINVRDDRGDTALLVAIGRKDPDWTGLLLNSGADVDAAARNGDSPLILAARLGFDVAAGWLIKLGAEIDSSNKMGETPLILAVQARNARLVELLLAAGADPDKSDYAGYSARDYAKRDNRSRRMSEIIEKSKPRG